MNKIIAAILLFFACLFVYTKLFGPFPFAVNSVQTTKQDLFQVTGQGSATAVPDTAHISFGVTKQAATVADAQNQTNTVVNAILAALKKLGINTKDLKTTNYSVNPNYSSSQTITGYTVTQNIDVKVQPLDKANQAIDTITKNGANLVGQVTFGFSDDMQKKLEDQARKDAVTKAKAQAQSLSQAAGVHLGPIINISENPTTPEPLVRPMALEGKVQDTNTAPTEITPGTSEITTSVTLSYQLY